MDIVGRIVALLLFFITAIPVASPYKYDLAYADYNLNENQYALGPLDYWSV